MRSRLHALGGLPREQHQVRQSDSGHVGLRSRRKESVSAVPEPFAVLRAPWLQTRRLFRHSVANIYVTYESIEKAYQEADLYVFGSTCETMPNVLVEAMSAGLPIASSSYGPMKEILRDGGEYMDPCNPNSIAEAVEVLLQSPEKRAEYANRAFRYADEYSWERTARETYRFLAEVARSS